MLYVITGSGGALVTDAEAEDFRKLRIFVDWLDGLYMDFTGQWQATISTQFNLRKKCVSDIEPNGALEQYIFDYKEFLSSCMGPDIAPDFEINIQKYWRLKTRDSLQEKIIRYKARDGGKYPINKCLNDLCGFRIILDENVPREDIVLFVKTTWADRKYRCMDASKGDYRAVHLYLQKNNTAFPWELQIWIKADEKSNNESHERYKHTYTGWEKA